MGKGGRAAAALGKGNRLGHAAHIFETTPLKDTGLEELRQHAKDRGLKTDGSREDLLIVLHPFSKVRELRFFGGFRTRREPMLRSCLKCMS